MNSLELEVPFHMEVSIVVIDARTAEGANCGAVIEKEPRTLNLQFLAVH